MPEKKRAAVAKTKQETIPIAAGRRIDRNIHFVLFVSFRIVRQVVVQGQCIKEKRITQTAVIHVQPFSTRRDFMT